MMAIAILVLKNHDMLSYFALVIRVLFLLIALGGIVYFLLAIYATRQLRRQRQPRLLSAPLPTTSLPPFSVLKPLCGAEPQLRQCLESFFCQQYPQFEILFAVHLADDPALAVVHDLQACYPQIPTQVIVTGPPPYANAKAYSMQQMSQTAHHQFLVVTDSDTSANPQYLQQLAAAFINPQVGVVTNLYRGVGGHDFWAKLEALGMSTEFMAGVIVANYLEGMKFALGPSMAVRRDCLQAIGGFAAMADYLADDFVLGEWATNAGYQVALVVDPVDHHASLGGFNNTFKHRLRWNRSTRFSRPQGYIGQGFTYGLAWAIIGAILFPHPWSITLLGIALVARIWLVWELGTRLLQDPLTLRRWWWIPLQDLLSLASWFGGFGSRKIIWRNQRYRLLDGGRFAPFK
jgi:ceramide glucosyltransferase